jgi:hypothetical protein
MWHPLSDHIVISREIINTLIKLQWDKYLPNYEKRVEADT